ncbi:DedA family protein [Thiomicrorhabdus sp. zzn3]|uniref:YqaA family protein n=1 Tax=Thiomicrorhabdus sp. zzn3 TaxID=3039775 RepID=UPI00243634B1|nr:DedA family protein [Thiomicrorhabdus sp. zzn3]MDG6778008.1 DedA family protein [Thiomicrorhabdus sp. zzn3]
MSLFSSLYQKTLQWAQHPKAPWYLGGISFAESSFFPIPPDVMLMPMALAKPQQAFRYAWITTLFSLLGGLLGYAIGYWLLDVIWPLIESLNYVDKFRQVEDFFAKYGVWIVFAAGFSPIPYKLFTISAGATGMALLPFIVASFVGRGARFFLVAWIMKIGGERYEDKIRQWIDWLGWLVVALIVMYLAVKLL